MNRRVLAVLLPVLSVSTFACKDTGKVSAEKAVPHAERIAKLVEADIGEIRKGLPAGAKKLADTLFAPEAKEVTPGQARAAMKKTREAVTDLQLAKSTFFAVADDKGMVYANDLETDGMSGKSVLAPVPALEKAKSGYVETLGDWDEARGVRTGDDVQWFAATPITQGATLRGLYVTGWSMRRFANHLEEQLKSDLRNDKAKQPGDKQPLVYVFVVRGKKAYGAPVAPAVNQTAVEGLDVLSKIQGDATWSGALEITNRSFGAAARKVKDLCEDCAVVVLRSET